MILKWTTSPSAATTRSSSSSRLSTKQNPLFPACVLLAVRLKTPRNLLSGSTKRRTSWSLPTRVCKAYPGAVRGNGALLLREESLHVVVKAVVLIATTIPRADVILLSAKTANSAFFVIPWASPASKMYWPGVSEDAHMRYNSRCGLATLELKRHRD